MHMINYKFVLATDCRGLYKKCVVLFLWDHIMSFIPGVVVGSGGVVVGGGGVPEKHCRRKILKYGAYVQ